MPSCKALVAASVDQIELQDVEVPDPGDSQVLVRTQYSVVSPGTEMRCLAGKQDGAALPFVMGYSAAGVIEKAGPNSGFTEGETVFSAGGQSFVNLRRQWGGHSQLHLQNANSVFRLPEGLSVKQAAVAKIAAIAYHGYRLAKPRSDQQVVLLGLGLLGQFSARLFAGVSPTVACDLDASRVGLAKVAGVEAVQIDRDMQPIMSDWQDKADIVVDVTGVAPVMEPAQSLLRARPWGDTEEQPPIYLIQGSYAGAVSYDYHAAFFKETHFICSRDQGPADLVEVLKLMASGSLKVDDLLEHEASPADAADVFKSLAGRSSLMTAVFDWSRV